VFAALTPLDRAKLAAVLDDVWVEAGSVVFEAGGHGDALYILRSGIAERRVAGSSIGRIEPPELFGELALLTDEPRSASVVAVTPLQLWVLPRARFHPLLKAEPEMLLRLSAAIGRQLAGTRRALGEMQRVLDDWTYQQIAELSPEERELIENAALFDHLDPGFLAEVLTIDRARAEAKLADIASRSPICTRDGDEYAIPSAIRRAITRKLEAELGHRRLDAMRRRAGLALEARGDEAGAVRAYLSAGAEGDARRCFDTAPRSVRDELVRDGRLASVGWASPSHQDGAGRGDAVPTRVRSLGRPRPKLIGLLLAVCPLLLWWLPGPAGLSAEGWRALLVLISGAILLAFDVLPDALVALLLTVGWIAPGLVEPRIGLSGFASPSWFLVLCVLAVGVAAGSTGLLYRLALLALVHVPPGFAWRANALALVGVVVTPSLANTTSRVALAAPLVRELAEALSYTPGSRAAAGLGQAALIGFGQMSALFITGSSVGLLTYGLLPAEVRAELGFAAWFVGALPVHVVLYCLSMAAVVLWFRPDSTPEGGTARLELQRAVLGPTSRSEWVALGVVVALLVGFLTESLHGVNAAWIGVGALMLLVAGGVLDASMLRSGVNWNFLIFFGVITSLSGVFTALGIDRWLAESLAGPIQVLGASPVLFCLALAAAGFILSLVVRWQAAAPLLTIVAMPAAATFGIHPFVVAVIALIATGVWFLPFQSTVYLALYHGSGELFSHRQARPLALAWMPIVLIAVAVAVPFWRMLGYVR
jgi:DASS family divalent anion:Na+ symporter